MITANISTTILSIVASLTEPTPAMVEEVTLTVSQRGGDIEDLGDDQYETTLWATGVLSNGSINQSTSVGLTCLVDHNTETVECTGMLGVGGNAVAIGYKFEDGDVRYRIDEDATMGQRIAWDKWFVDELIDVMPPVDENGDPDTSSGSILTGNGPGAIIVANGWLILPYRSDWLIIIDGIVMNPDF